MFDTRVGSSDRIGTPLFVILLSSCFAVGACGHAQPDDGGAPQGGTSPGGASASGAAGASNVAGATFGGAPGAAGNGRGGTSGSLGAAGSFSTGGSVAGSANPAGGRAETAGNAGSIGNAGNPGAAGQTMGNAGSAGSTGSAGASGFGTPMQSSDDRYRKAEVTRNGINYFFMANGWGPGFQSQSVSWNGTSFTVTSMQGSQGAGYEPASYPTVFCGVYSDSRSGACGLPRPVTEIQSIRTGWRWRPNGNTGEYNAAYDVWLGNGESIQSHSSFLMVWLREPPGQQPAGMPESEGISVANVPGVWDVWAGTVGGKPCISYVRAEGQDTLELEFDVMDFVRDVPTRNITLPGSHILSVAVGFEIWNGPVTNLVSEDFYVDVR